LGFGSEIVPEKSRSLGNPVLDPVYLYNNTFNVSSPIDWSGSGGEDALDKYRYF